MRAQLRAVRHCVGPLRRAAVAGGSWLCVTLTLLLVTSPGGAHGVRIGIAVPTHSKRHYILNVSRATWRAPSLGVPTVVSTDSDAAEHVMPTPQWGPLETWVAGPDGEFGWETQGGNKAEQRCTGVMRVANTTLRGAYDWLLNGDDDVIWLLDNVPGLVAGLDASVPVYLTDGFLNGIFVGCSRDGVSETAGAGGCTRTKPAQPCSRDVLLADGMCYAEQARDKPPGQLARAGVWAAASIWRGAARPPIRIHSGVCAPRPTHSRRLRRRRRHALGVRRLRQRMEQARWQHRVQCSRHRC
jgi:hypothetical protein